MIKENWDIKVLGRNETILHFATVEANPEMATAHHFISFVDKPAHELLSPVEIPSLCLYVHDIHPGQHGPTFETGNPAILFANEHAQQIFDFADKNKIGEAFGRTLIQCAVGVSRSSATALALLVHGGFEYQDAFDLVMKVRPYIHPNIWMIEVFDRTLNRNGEFLEFYKGWYRQKEAEGAFKHVPAEKHYKV